VAPVSGRPPSSPPPYTPLAGQVVVITGASSGIGLVTACKAAQAGARVFLIARDGETLGRVAEQIRAAGGQADWAVADVGDEAAVETAAQAAVNRFGGIDTWVNNAGVAIYADLLETPRDEHERLFRTNYWGVVNGAAAAVKRLRPRGGAFITVGSIVSDMGTPVLGAYAASKHAVKGYLDSLRIELSREHAPISVTLIKPSGVGTPLNDHVANHMPGRPNIPRPVYAPELVAEAILYAAQRPVREITVGGVGRIQTLAAQWAPGLFARLAGLVTSTLYDSEASPETAVNLFAPRRNGLARSPRESGRAFSLYAWLRLHPGRSALALSAMAVFAGAVFASRGPRYRASVGQGPRKV
jgi:short-subunit dehydrogenase